MGLFSVSGENAVALRPSVFAERHVEKDIQVWADRCPALINDGKPMLSLGMEITTKHGLFIDNLYLDGNGTLVAAEMKRGRTPREVVAQIVEYASYVSGLDWPVIEQFCQKTHGLPLDTAYPAKFGRNLPRQPKPAHRLVIVAESFDPRVFDNALYLINSGSPLALIQFTYYRLGEAEMVDTTTILGEIPEQLPPSLATTPANVVPSLASAEVAVADNGYSAWLLSTIAEKLMETAAMHGWQLRHKVNRQTLPFGDVTWPLGLGECQLRVDTWKGGVVALRLIYRTNAAPGLAAFLEAHHAEWADRYAGTMAKPNTPSQDTYFTAELPRPALGDQAGVMAVFVKVEAMAEALLPLLSAYFAQANTSTESPTKSTCSSVPREYAPPIETVFGELSMSQPVAIPTGDLPPASSDEGMEALLLAGKPIAVTVMPGGSPLSFLIGGFAQLGKRLCWVQAGWDDPDGYGGHPTHFAETVVDPRGPGPWKGENITFHVLEEEVPEDDSLFWSWINWRGVHDADWQQSIEKGNALCAKLLITG